MTDVHTTEQRRFNMQQIKTTNTRPEMLVRRFLHAQGFRYKLHDKTLPGKPDLVLPKYKTVIFVHGCFWHGHKGCRYNYSAQNKNYMVVEEYKHQYSQRCKSNICIAKIGVEGYCYLGMPVKDGCS